MDQELVALQQKLTELAQIAPDDQLEFWFARDLLKPLG